MNNDKDTLVNAHEALVWDGISKIPNKIHYACGRNVLEGWVNTDYFESKSFPMGTVPENLLGKVFHVDLANQHPFPTGQFDFAFCEDFVEHLSQMEAMTFLFEAYRCLSHNGVIRISTPGVQSVMFRHYYDIDFSGLSEAHYQCYTRWGHKHLFSHDTLRAFAYAVGFRRYKECIVGRSEIPEFQGLDTRLEQIDFNIVAELTK